MSTHRNHGVRGDCPRGRSVVPHLCRWMMILVFLPLAGLGCRTPGLEEDPSVKVRTERLDQIETVALEDKSVTTPVTVDEASRQISDVVQDANDTEQVVELSLEQVRAAALTNNLDLKVELISPSIAQRTLDAERAKFESAFFGSASYQHRDDADNNAESEGRSYEVGWSQPLHTGGSVRVSTGVADTDWSNSDGVADAAASVAVIQSLLRDAGTRVNTHSIRIAGYGKHIVDARTKLRAIHILSGADIAYWSLFAALRELDVRRQQYKLAQDQLAHARRKVASRSAAKIEIVRAEAGLAGRLDSMIRAEAAVSDRQRELKRIMNRTDIPVNSVVSIRTATAPRALGLDLDAEALADAALENRMEMVILALQLGIDEMYIDLARNATLPDLDLEYSYATDRSAGSLGRAISHLDDERSDSHAVGVSARIPVGNRAARARLQRARLERLQTRASEESLKADIREQVYAAVNSLDQSWRSILAAEQGVIQAERNYEVEQGQFKLGRRTSTDVLQAATNLADAQLRKIRSFAQYEVAQVYLARATGTLLGRDRIELEPIDLEG